MKMYIYLYYYYYFKQSPCQKLEFENREYDGILFDPLAGLIATLANSTCDSDPSEYNDIEKSLPEAIDTLLPGIDKHLQSYDETTVAWVMGCYCQLAQYNVSFTQKYSDKLLNTVYIYINLLILVFTRIFNN